MTCWLLGWIMVEEDGSLILQRYSLLGLLPQRPKVADAQMSLKRARSGKGGDAHGRQLKNVRFSTYIQLGEPAAA